MAQKKERSTQPRSNIAQKKAISYAVLQGLMPDEAAASLPIPDIFPSGPCLDFMIYRGGPDDEVQDYVVYEPELQLNLDAKSLDVVWESRWRKPVEGDQERPFSLWQSHEAHQLPLEKRDALETELFFLLDDAAKLFWEKGKSKKTDVELIERFSSIFFFLTAPRLLPYYERLNPTFFDWLQENTRGIPLPARNMPEPKPGLDVPGRPFPEPWTPVEINGLLQVDSIDLTHIPSGEHAQDDE